MADSVDKSMRNQLALLKTLADRPLTLPPIFADVTGSINAGLLLAQVIYWMPRTENSDGWFYKKLPEFQKELRMGEKEFLNARRKLKSLGFLDDELRGSPPKLFFRANLPELLNAVQARLRTNDEVNRIGGPELILSKGQTQFRPRESAIQAKRQKHNFDKTSKSYKETETTRDQEETTGVQSMVNSPVSQTHQDHFDALVKSMEILQGERFPSNLVI